LDPSDRQNFKREVPVLARIQAELRVAAQAGPKLSFQVSLLKNRKQKTETKVVTKRGKQKKEKNLEH
jgi:hypothetical protein